MRIDGPHWWSESNFLDARINEEEATARAALEQWESDREGGWFNGLSDETKAHALGLDPRQVIAGCGARRSVVEVYEDTYRTRAQIDYEVGDPDMNDVIGPLRDVMRALLVPYRQHPDYSPDWL